MDDDLATLVDRLLELSRLADRYRLYLDQLDHEHPDGVDEAMWLVLARAAGATDATRRAQLRDISNELDRIAAALRTGPHGQPRVNSAGATARTVCRAAP